VGVGVGLGVGVGVGVAVAGKDATGIEHVTASAVVSTHNASYWFTVLKVVDRPGCPGT
jgi:hypothetical protein